MRKCLLLCIPAFLFLYGGAKTPKVSLAETDVIQIKGSDTMVNLGQAWAEEFMNRHPEASIAVTGGGSGTGIAALINGTTNIAQSSREMKPEEKEKVLRTTGEEVKEFVVGMDALAVISHPANPVSELSIDQLSDIFTSRITDWKDVGGLDEPMLVLSRERNSGTHVYFLEQVLRKGNEKGPEEFSASVLMMLSSQVIAQEVARSRAAIGYLGLGYVTKEHKTLAVRKTSGDRSVLPSVETAQNGTYPISRPLYLYTAGESEGTVKQFIDFILSPEGQEIVRLMDFVPLQEPAKQQ
jgi:phosphate transport system substrate-binding protein